MKSGACIDELMTSTTITIVLIISITTTIIIITISLLSCLLLLILPLFSIILLLLANSSELPTQPRGTIHTWLAAGLSRGRLQKLSTL